MIQQFLAVSALPMFAVLLTLALVSDVVWLRIPNWITLSLLTVFLIVASATPHDAAWWLSHFGAGVLMLTVGLGLFAWGKLGGGDAKLMAGIGLWAGLGLLPPLLLAIGVINGAVILAFMAMRRYSIGEFLETHGIQLQSLSQGKDMPFAVAAAAGSWVFVGDFLT
jgi:prepilin peptidase CpaA